MTMPHEMMRKESQMLGRTRLRTMFEGISVARRQQSCIDTPLLGHTKYDVWNKEYRGCYVILVAREAKVLVHALDLCIADVRAVDVGQKVEHSHDWNKTDVDLVCC
jgi:hypothetical protein